METLGGGDQKYDVATVLCTHNHLMRWVRKSKGLTQKELADLAGTSVENIQQLESFSSVGCHFHYEVLDRLGQILDQPVQRLFPLWLQEKLVHEVISDAVSVSLTEDVMVEGPDCVNAYIQEELLMALEAEISALSLIESAIVRDRFGWGGVERQTLDELGVKYHFTRERIRQIEAKALRTLRQKMGNGGWGRCDLPERDLS